MSRLFFILIFFIPCLALSRDTLLLAPSLPEVIFEDEKNESDRVFVPQKINSIDANAIQSLSPQSTSDALKKSGNIMVQESQSGGGSPIIRGFEANRIVIVIDGIRLNNAIFRSGHLQNIASTSPIMLEKIDVVFGPSSVKYGSDALGGVIHIHTKNPTEKQKTKRTFYQQFSSANNGVSSHFDISWSKGKWAFLSGLSLRKNNNLKMGENRLHKYQYWGLEDHVTKGTEQLYTSYGQVDIIQKILLHANKNLYFLLNTQYSSTSDINRFDKLNDLVNNNKKYEQWFYGPQKRLLNSISAKYQKKTAFFDDINSVFSLQNFEESRNSQKTEGTFFKRKEKVSSISSTTDLNKSFGYNNINYGFDLQHNMVFSSSEGNYPSRYADGGSLMNSFSIYGQYKKMCGTSSFFSVGGRYNNTMLHATFNDTASYQLPFTSIKMKNNAITGGFGGFINFKKGWEMSCSISSGFRSPNVDDVTKVFSKGGSVTVPNDKLGPEYSYNLDVLIKKSWSPKTFLSANYFYTLLKDAIIKKEFVLNGQSTLVYDEETLPIVAHQNTQEAFLFGYSLDLSIKISKYWSSENSLSYTFGKDRINNTPMDHIPPVYGKSSLVWVKNFQSLRCYLLFNGWKKMENYSVNGSDNPEEATIDGTPSWWTINISYSKDIKTNLTGRFGVENLLDVHYKAYSSGISAAGRNFTFSLLATF